MCAVLAGRLSAFVRITTLAIWLQYEPALHLLRVVQHFFPSCTATTDHCAYPSTARTLSELPKCCACLRRTASNQPQALTQSPNIAHEQELMPSAALMRMFQLSALTDTSLASQKSASLCLREEPCKKFEGRTSSWLRMPFVRCATPVRTKISKSLRFWIRKPHKNHATKLLMLAQT